MGDVVSLDRSLDAIGERIRSKWVDADKLEGKALDARIAVGRLLVEAQEQVQREGLGWEAWCKEQVWARSQRDIRKVMALARSPDPETACEAEKADRRASDARRAERSRSCPVSQEANVDLAAAQAAVVALSVEDFAAFKDWFRSYCGG